MTYDEREVLLKSINTKTEELIIKGLLYTGMRAGELFHLIRRWVDFGTGMIYIPEKQKCECTECVRERKGIWTPKTEQAIRGIPIVPEFEDILKVFLENHSSMSEIIIDRTHIWKIVKRVSKRAGIEHNVFPHAIRATFANILVDKEYDIFAITEVLGWKNIATADKYIRSRGGRARKAFREKW